MLNHDLVTREPIDYPLKQVTLDSSRPAFLGYLMAIPNTDAIAFHVVCDPVATSLFVSYYNRREDFTKNPVIN